MTAKLFTPVELGGLTLPNRIVNPRWAWNAAHALGVETPPLPAVRATTILPFKPQPAMARAAE